MSAIANTSRAERRDYAYRNLERLFDFVKEMDCETEERYVHKTGESATIQIESSIQTSRGPSSSLPSPCFYENRSNPS